MMFVQCLYNCNPSENVCDCFIESGSPHLSLQDCVEYSAGNESVLYEGFDEDLEYKGFNEGFE